MGCGVNKLIFGITGTEEPDILNNVEKIMVYLGFLYLS
jgi:hypothetical protein